MTDQSAPTAEARGLLAYAEDAAHVVGCASLFAILCLVTADVVLRTAINKTVPFQFELTEIYLMPALATLPLARVQRLGGHLAIDFVDLKFLGALGPLIRRLNTALPAALFACIAWMSGQYALAAWTRSETNMGVIDWPMYIAYAAVPIGTGLLTLRLALETIRGKTETTSH